jgi:hypothetical protein
VTFDITAEIDNKLTFEENKEIIRDKLKKFLPEIAKTKIMNKEEFNLQQQKNLNEFELQAEKEFNRVLDKISNDKTTETIEDIYFIPKQFVKMVAKRNSKGLLLYGEAGLGKTYSVIKAFQEVNIPFVMLSGHITSLELYHFLFEHRTENIVLDDVNILENEQNLNMLKASLSDNSRVVQYHTSSSRLRVPNKFVFDGGIILLLNSIPRKSESLKAVESRILTYELKMDYNTKIKIIYELSKTNYKDLNENERANIVKWIKENTNSATENLNLRLLFLCYEFYRFDKDNWIKLANKIIKNNSDVYLIVQGLKEKEWCEQTGRHRATYYRLKQKI